MNPSQKHGKGVAECCHSERIPYFDNLKYVLVVLVVVGHAITPMAEASMGEPLVKSLYDWIYLFHMPAFVFISGLFAKSAYSTRTGLKVRRMMGFLSIYLFMLAYYWLVAAFLGHGYIFGLFSTTGAPWYMVAMFWWYLSLPFAVRFKASHVLVGAIALSFMSGFAGEFGAFLSLGRTVALAPFFYAGYYLNREVVFGIRVRGGKSIVKVCSFALLAVVFFLAYRFPLLVAYWLDISSGWVSYPAAIGSDSFFLAVGAGLVRIAAYGVSALLGLACAMLVPLGSCPISKLGTRTLQVYALHPLFTNIAYFSNLDSAMLAITLYWPLFCIVLSIVLSIALASQFIEKPFQRALGKNRILSCSEPMPH